jgi:hypothetical protein
VPDRPDIARLRAGFPPALLCVAAATLCACATLYQPTERRVQDSGNLRAEATEVEGPLRTVTLALEAAGPQRIEAIRLGSEHEPPCSSDTRLVALDARTGEHIELPQELDGAAAVKVALAAEHVRAPALTLDVDAPVVLGGAADAPTGYQARCLRVRLTAREPQVLWRARGPVWSTGGTVRVDVPAPRALDAPGAGATAELRGLRPVGPVRLALGGSFGGAGCRGHCPSVHYTKTSDGDDGLVGVFWHLGAFLGLERRVPLGRYALDLGAGAGSTVAVMSVPKDYVGERWAILGGPFATLRFIFPERDRPTGFSPAVMGGRQGIELQARRTLTLAPAPHDAGWFFSLGWSYEGPL